MSRLRLLLLVLAAALWPAVAFVPHVLAQPAADPGRALTLGHEAIDLYNRGSWTEAGAKFAEAERIAHSPVFVLYLARCARNAGDLGAAKEAYEQLAKEVVPKDAPAPWAGAIESARQELSELKARIAEARAAASATASVAPAVSVAPTATAATTTTTPAPSVTVAPSASSTAGPAAPPPGASTRGSLAPGAVVVGAGALGIGVGIGLFAHALSIAQGIDSRCLGGCPGELANRNTAYSFADGATAAFVVGGAALAAGVVLLIARPGGRPGSPPQVLSLQPGVGALRLSGTF